MPVMLLRPLCVVVLASVLASVTPGSALAGLDAPLQEEWERILEIREQVESHPIYWEQQRLYDELEALFSTIESLAGADAETRDAEILRIREQIDDVHRQLETATKILVNFEEQISAGQGRKYFSRAAHRVAVFTFDDPDDTGLGDAISFLLSKKILFSTRVRSFGIVNYQQGVEPAADSRLAYYDKVEAITRDQDYLAALWGRVSRTAHGVQVDAFLQLPTKGDESPFARSFVLPEGMGGGTMVARIKPDRFQVQSMSLDEEGIADVREAVARIRELRSDPREDAGVRYALEESRPYVIVDSRDDWVELRVAGAERGWTSVDAFCRNDCRTLLDAATFTNDVVAASSGGAIRPSDRQITVEAQAVSAQLTAINALAREPDTVPGIVEGFARRNLLAAEPSAIATVPGAAGFANILGLGLIGDALERSEPDAASFDAIRLEPEFISGIANGLAAASVADPNDLDTLQNLANLFGYLGDDTRRQLALDIRQRVRLRAER